MNRNHSIRKVLHGCLLVGVLFFTLAAGSPPTASTYQELRRTSADAVAQGTAPAALQDFDLLSETDGWILTASQLYWTSSNGLDWKNITPALPPDPTIYAVKFLNTDLGRILWSNSQPDGSLALQLESTSDQGGHWTNTIIQTLSPDDPNYLVGSASMDWLDENTGWVSVKQLTGSNFSSGIAFRTEDGGHTWVRLSLPIGEPVHFVTNRVGWMAGGPARDELFKTLDGGNNWSRQFNPAEAASSQSISLYAPVFDSTENGLLPVVIQTGNDFQFQTYASGDGGQSWKPISSVPLGSQVGLLPLSRFDGRDLVVAVPDSNRIIQLVDGNPQNFLNQDGLSAGIVDLKMLSFNFGWAKWEKAACTQQTAADGSTNKSCTSTTKLLETRDGGITWETLAFPRNSSGALTQSSQVVSSGQVQINSAGPGKTLLQVGQGFDICTIPTIAQLQTWWNSSPYQAVNLYIGGAARACANPALTASYLNQMRQQGWTFIPTWVGPQAPCTTFIHRFSSDVDTAYVQGRDEAYFASAALAALGLTTSNLDLSGSVAYYDMEMYGNDAACRNAVNAFVNGWVTHMHDLGNLAGVYGATGISTSSGCTSGLGDYLTIPNIPDAIWPARWYLPAGEGTYDPSASVWDIGSCIPSSAWNNHQRIRQYAGDHSESWGGIALGGIDSDVLDGVVAVPYFGTPSPNFSISILSSPALTVRFTITNTAFLSTCSWNYGDGQNGTSCASTSTHTYALGGTYTVSLTVSSSWGAENLTSRNTVTLGPTTTTTITAISSDSPDPSVAGQPVTINYSVTGSPGGSGTPTGNVTVSDGTQSCTGTVASGSCIITFTTPGEKALTATYVGDANFSGSTSTPATAHTVNKANTTTTISSDLPDPSVVGQPVSISYSVAVVAPGSGTPSGGDSVTVSDGTQSCTGTVAAGSCSIAFMTSGAKTLIATYAGGTNFNGSASSPATTHIVTPANTTTTITSDLPDPSMVGQSVTVNYSVTVTAPGSGTPSGGGNVTVSDGTQSCTGTVSAGSCSIVFAAPGAKTLIATYAGGTNFNGSVSTPATSHTVNKANTTTTILSDLPDPSSIGQTVTINYSVVATAPGSGSPTGNVTVSDGTQSCTGTVSAGSCSIAFATAGAKALTATYAGDANFNASTSANESHTVRAGTTTVITSDTPNPSVVGQPVIINYSVAVIPPGSGTPTGTVTVSDGTQSCTGGVAAGSCSIAFVTSGVKNLIATYAGGVNFNGSVSTPATTHTVNKANITTRILFDLPDPSSIGQTVTINYSVVATAPGSGSPTGNVTVSDGTQSCTGTVSAGSCSIAFATSGVKALTATYAGDANFNASTSAIESHTVSTATNAAGTTTVITSDTPDPSVVGQPVIINYSVAVIPPGSGTPTGTVTVSDGTQSCTGGVAAGSCSIVFVTSGVKNLTAAYAGNVNFNGSVSTPATTHTVTPANTTTTITSDSPDPSVVGQPVIVNFSVTVTAPGSGTPTGNVTVSDGTQSCTGTVAAGSCSIAFAAPGVKTLTATYAGGTNFNGSASSPATTHTVNIANTTTAITSHLPNPSAVGRSYPVTFSVTSATGGAPTGNVTVSDGTHTCVAPVTSGKCNLTSTTAGTKLLTATYAGDGNFSGSISTAVAHIITYWTYLPIGLR